MNPENTFPEREAERLIPEQQVQRQDSTHDQLRTVMELAKRAGCYDAHDAMNLLLDMKGECYDAQNAMNLLLDMLCL